MRKFLTPYGEVWILIQENAKCMNVKGVVMRDPSGSHLFVNRKELATFTEI